MFLCTTPKPPCSAMAMAIELSVTVSIPALMNGRFNFKFFAN